jgi:CHAD domain-containing protein
MNVTRLSAGSGEPRTARPVNPSDPGPAHAGLVVSNPDRDWKKVRQLALRRLERFVSLEPKVLRGDDPDAIHDIRVASRRLQQVLDLLYPKPQPREIRRMRRRIRRCRRAFGNVRNYDVFLGHVDRYLSRKRISRREAWSAIQEYVRARRARLFQKALRRFNRQNLTGLYVRLREHLRAAGTAANPSSAAPDLDPSPEVVARDFWPRLAQSLEQLWTAFEAQVSESRRNPCPTTIHGARIAAKRLRYLLEVVYEFRVRGCADQLAWLRRLQQHLGDWHDLEIQGQLLAGMVGRPAFLREHLELGQEIMTLMRREQAGKKRYEDKYFLQVRDSLEWLRLNQWIAHLLASCSASLAGA